MGAHTKVIGGYVRGSGALNPFEGNPQQMPAHVCSFALLLMRIQRKRREPQVAIEVGVWQGIMSRWLLWCLPKLHLHCVDPWQAGDPAGSWYQHGDRFAKRPQEQLEANYELVKELAEQFAPRVTIHRKASPAAAAEFADGSADAIFIDAAHDHDSVYADVHAWRPKVRPGGWLSGHDYKENDGYFGLPRAVRKATSELGLTIQVYPGKVWYCQIPD